MEGIIIGAVVVILVLIVIVKNINVVQQSKAYVVERLGAFSTVWEVGLHFKVPFIERVAKRVSLKELPDFLKKHFEEGERYIDSFEDPDDPAYRQVILEKNPY